MKTYVIEREIAGIGSMSGDEHAAAARQSNAALAQLAPKVTWQHSYVTGNKTFCIYDAESRAAIEEHAAISGFPANIITEVVMVMEPATGT